MRGSIWRSGASRVCPLGDDESSLEEKEETEKITFCAIIERDISLIPSSRTEHGISAGVNLNFLSIGVRMHFSLRIFSLWI